MVNYFADGSLLCNGGVHCFAMEGLIVLQWKGSSFGSGAWLVRRELRI